MTRWGGGGGGGGEGEGQVSVWVGGVGGRRRTGEWVGEGREGGGEQDERGNKVDEIDEQVGT